MVTGKKTENCNKKQKGKEEKADATFPVADQSINSQYKSQI